MADPVIFENYQPKFIWSDVQDVKTIYQEQSTNDFRFEGSTYTVPAGRKAYVIEFQIATRNAQWGFELQYYDSATTTWTSLVGDMNINPNTAGDFEGPPVFHIFKELAAGDQLRALRTYGADVYGTLIALVVEVNT